MSKSLTKTLISKIYNNFFKLEYKYTAFKQFSLFHFKFPFFCFSSYCNILFQTFPFYLEWFLSVERQPNFYILQVFLDTYILYLYFIYINITANT